MAPKLNTNLPRGIYQREPGSKFYHIQYTDALGRRRREKAGTLYMAETLLIKRKMDVLRHKVPGGVNKVGVKMNELIDDAINYAFANNDEKAAHDLRLKLERIREAFGDKDLGLVTKKDIVAWLDSEAAKRNWKPSSRNRYHSAFSMMFRVAIENGKAEVNAASGIHKKQEDNGRIRFLSREEETALVKAIEEMYPQYLPAFMLSLHTGMRLSEQRRAVVGDYNAETGTMMVHQKKNRRALAVRHVPMTPIAVKAYEQLCIGRKPGELLCTNTRGDALRNVRYWFDDCVKVAGVSDYTWHCNRHTTISRWVMAGVPITAVADYAGHANISMTRRYAHVAPETNRFAIERMMSWYEDKPAVVERDAELAMQEGPSCSSL